MRCSDEKNQVQALARTQPGLPLNFTPTSASWPNIVERFFRDISKNRLRHGGFTSVPELTTAIEQYVANHIANPKPFIWTASARDILQKAIRAHSRLSSKKNAALRPRDRIDFIVALRHYPAPANFAVTHHWKNATDSNGIWLEASAVLAVSSIPLILNLVPRLEGAEFMFARGLRGIATMRGILLTVALMLSSTPLFAQVPLTIAKSFSPATVVIGGTSTTTMTVTITNPNGVTVNGIGFNDTYPAGLVPDAIGAYTCAAGSAVFNGTGFSIGNVTLGAGASCSVPVHMHATVTGPITNSTSQVSGTGVPSGGPASATLNVTPAAPATIPTLSDWMLIVLAALIATMAILSIRKPAR